MKSNKDASYDQGDWIVHFHHGVGQIEDIERIQISDHENTYYRINTGDNADTTIWIPAEQMEDGQLRPITDKKEFQEAVEVLKKPPKKMDSNLNKRKARIKEVSVNNVPKETARLIRDLRARRRSKGGLNQGERQALNNLTKRFVQEWAASIGMTIEQARSNLRGNLGERREATRRDAETTPKKRSTPDESTLLDSLVKLDERWDKWFKKRVAEGV